MRVALVTGAAAGIGAAIARRLARDGIAVGVLDFNSGDAGAVASEINAAGWAAIALEASVTARNQVQDAVAELRRHFGPVSILVNNAGMSAFRPFLEISDEEWDRMFEVNLKGAFIVTQVVLPDMLGEGWGRIINVSSSSAQSGAAGMAHYSSSKGGMIALTKSLAREFGPRGITCNTIPPRFIQNTVMSRAAYERPGMQERYEANVKAGPIQRSGEPEDIAGACAYLASEEAGYVTGQVIGVNGGRYI